MFSTASASPEIEAKKINREETWVFDPPKYRGQKRAPIDLFIRFLK